MLSMQNVSVSQAAGYYEKDDYYTEQGKMPAKFAGKLMAHLGLHGPFDQERFVEALHGQFNGGQLKWAKAPSTQRAGLDMTFSAPKSVSVQALVVGDKRIIEAHDQAVDEAMSYVEQLARCRLTENKKTCAKEVDGIAYASFRHDTSREGDPNLHTHNVVLKAVLGPEGHLRSLDNQEFFHHQHALDAIYKQALATKLRAIGYDLLSTAVGFEIAGYSSEVLSEFSRRTEQINRALEQRGMSRQASSAEARAISSVSTRKRKEHYDRKSLQERWLARAFEHGFPLPRKAVSSAKTSVVDISADEALAQAIANLTERRSVIKNRSELLADAMRAGNQHLTYKQVSEALNKKLAKGEILTGYNGRALVTLESLNTERRIDAAYEQGKGALEPMATHNEVELGILDMEKRIAGRLIAATAAQLGRELTSEEKDIWYARAKLTAGQEKMVRNITTGRDAICVVEGDAGTGKSTAMEAVKIIAESNGFSVLGLAPSAQAVNALIESGLETITSQSALVNPVFWEKVDNKSLVILDEAGLVDVRSMAKILGLAQEKGARIVTVGDTKQFGSVEAGSALDQLRRKADAAGLLTRLSEMRRGTTDFIRDLHFASRDNAIQAVDMLYEKGDVQVIKKREERLLAIARHYAAMSPAEREKSFVLTGKNSDRIAINEAIRDELMLDEGVAVRSFEAKDKTTAEVRRLGSYEIGDVIKFTSKSGVFNKDDLLTVLEKKSDRLVVQTHKGERVDFLPHKQAKNCTIGTIEEMRLATGDRIRFTANDTARLYANGDRGTVLKVEDRKAVVQLDKDHRQVTLALDSSKPLPIRHGYVQTGHSAQGGKGQTVLLHQQHDDVTINKNSFYTNLTRSTDRVVVFTDAAGGKQLEKLRSSISRPVAPDLSHAALQAPETFESKKAAYLAPRKGYEKLDVHDSTDRRVVERALLEAEKRYCADGGKLFVAGDAAFKKTVVDIASRKQSRIEFDDRQMEAERLRKIAAFNVVVENTQTKAGLQPRNSDKPGISHTKHQVPPAVVAKTSDAANQARNVDRNVHVSSVTVMTSPKPSVPASDQNRVSAMTAAARQVHHQEPPAPSQPIAPRNG